MTTDSTSMSSPVEPAPARLKPFEGFMATVRRVCAQPEGRAVLRDGLAVLHESLDDKSVSPWQMYMQLLAFDTIPSWRKEPEDEFPYLLVAAMYALHDAPNPRVKKQTSPGPATPAHDLGWSFASAARKGVMRQKTAADHLTTLVQLERLGLYRELPGAVSLLRSKGVTVQWPVLLRDLTRWPQHAGVDVRIAWVRHFHAPIAQPSPSHQ